MKDGRGLYYHPYPDNKRLRMYVRQVGDDICFRIWDSDDGEMWNRHGWVPYRMIERALPIYRPKPGCIDPRIAYDLRVAYALIADEKAGIS